MILIEILLTSPYPVGMWENADQNNSEYGHFLHSEEYQEKLKIDSFKVSDLLSIKSG